jgi:formate dehydrogenase accessory protein FdhD
VAAGLPPAVREMSALRIDRGERQSFSDAVIEEAPVALLYNGVSHAVMMATPADLEDYALGFSLAEGIVEEPAELRYVEATDSGMGWVVELLVAQAHLDRLHERRRSLLGASGCGLCGVESLQAALRPAPAVPWGFRTSTAAIVQGVRALAEAQVLNRRSGGVHAAGYVHARGILVREDVGRHNALDKLVGALRRSDTGEGFLVLSSRASYELVHKAACAGIGVVVAISAPTTLAIELAQASGITLVAFARGEQMNVYTHADRIA